MPAIYKVKTHFHVAAEHAADAAKRVHDAVSGRRDIRLRRFGRIRASKKGGINK